MFQYLITAAKDILRRLEICEQKGISRALPEERVRQAESEAWCRAAEGEVFATFGSGSPELQRWIAFRATLDNYMSEGLQHSPVSGYITHLHQSVGLLAEFEALAARRPAAVPSSAPNSSTTEPKRDHTLMSYWQHGSWADRFGLVGVLALVFIVGLLCGKTQFFSKLYDLLKDVAPW
jgi:hypothetical protein